MIVCPNCKNENADDSVHCGFCGHQLQEGSGKKTMFGMAALNADQIQQAADAAKAARAEQATPQAPSLNLPSAPQPQANPAAPSLNLGSQDDASAFAKTEMMPSISQNSEPLAAPPAAEPPKKDPFADEFAALEATYGNDPDFSAPVDPTPSGPQDIVDPAPTPSMTPQQPASAGFGASPSGAPAAGPANGPQGPTSGNFGSAPKGGPQGPASMGAGGAMQKAPNQQMTKKKDNKVLIIVGVLAVLGFFGCIGLGVVLKLVGVV